MALNLDQINRIIESRPPRCLRRFRPKLLPMPTRAKYDLIAAWRLVCECRSSQGTVLGHPLAQLKKGENSPMFVSPFAFKCGKCRKTTKFLDTRVDGAGAELGKLAKSKYGSADYRGQGRKQPYPCPKCGAARGEVVVKLFFNQDSMYALEQRGIAFPWENLFNGVHVHSTCAECGERSMVTDLDLKY